MIAPVFCTIRRMNSEHTGLRHRGLLFVSKKRGPALAVSDGAHSSPQAIINYNADAKRGLIKGTIGLPANLFYGTGIPACIVVVDKQDAHARKGIFMIDASAGFMKDGPKSRLRAQDIHKIVDVFNKLQDVPKYARMV